MSYLSTISCFPGLQNKAKNPLQIHKHEFSYCEEAMGAGPDLGSLLRRVGILGATLGGGEALKGPLRGKPSKDL